MLPSTIPPELQVNFDFDAPGVSREARILKPAVFRDGNVYCCLLGQNPVAGIFGRGETPEAAVRDWETSLRDRRQYPKEDDEVVLYVEDTLRTVQG